MDDPLTLLPMDADECERAAQAILAAARMALAAEGTAAAGDRCREYFAAWAGLLAFYAPLPPGESPRPLRPELAAMLKNMFRELAAGSIPKPMADCEKRRKRGRAAPGPIERQHISIAVAYAKAADDGDIDDSAPIKTIMGRYGVSRRTVQDWRKNIPPMAELSGPALERAMVAAGEYYQQAGRSTVAINNRYARANRI